MKTSAAIRVNAMLEKASQNNANSPVLVAFAQIFELAPPDVPLAMDAVMVALNEFREEIHRAARSLKDAGAPNELTDMPIGAAFSLTSPMYLAHAWRQHREQQLRVEVLTSWKLLAHFVQHDVEEEVSAEVLHELETELADLTETAKADGVPQELRTIIIRQADRIRKALRRYRVEGIEPLREAVSAGIGELILAEPVLTSIDQKIPATKNALAKLLKTLGKAAKIAKDVTAVAAAYKLVAKVVPALQHYAEEVEEALGILDDSWPATGSVDTTFNLPPSISHS